MPSAKAWENDGIFGICDRLFITNSVANLNKISNDTLSTDPKMVLTTLNQTYRTVSFSIDEVEIIKARP